MWLLVLLLAACAPEARVIESPLVQRLETGWSKGHEVFDHSVWHSLLQEASVPAQSRVRYSVFKTRQDALDSYLKTIADVDMTRLNRDEQMALLINAYNAYTVRLILENYPGVKSIRDLNSPWKTARYTVGGETLSLDDIEHGLLRPIFKDPRIHFAVNCASIGCPPLADFAFTGANLEAQLETVTRETLQNPAYVRLNGTTLEISSLLDWYGGDFINPTFKGASSSVTMYVAGYATEDVAKVIRANPKSVNFLPYDWRLNDKTP